VAGAEGRVCGAHIAEQVDVRGRAECAERARAGAAAAAVRVQHGAGAGEAEAAAGARPLPLRRLRRHRAVRDGGRAQGPRPGRPRLAARRQRPQRAECHVAALARRGERHAARRQRAEWAAGARGRGRLVDESLSGGGQWAEWRECDVCGWAQGVQLHDCERECALRYVYICCLCLL